MIYCEKCVRHVDKVRSFIAIMGHWNFVICDYCKTFLTEYNFDDEPLQKCIERLMLEKEPSHEIPNGDRVILENEEHYIYAEDEKTKVSRWILIARTTNTNLSEGQLIKLSKPKTERAKRLLK